MSFGSDSRYRRFSRGRWVAGAFALFILLGCGLFVAEKAAHVESFQAAARTQDVYYIWLDGQRIASGENPYSRILSGNMRENDKYSTYLPLFYEASALSHWLGVHDFDTWNRGWEKISLAFYLATGGLLFTALYVRGSLLLAVAGSVFWLFSRWTVNVLLIRHVDFVPIFFMVASLITFRQFRKTSLLSLGVSLAVKQIAIFLLPLFLVREWRRAPDKRVFRTLNSFGLIVFIPFLASLPFVVWNADAFLSSMAFSVTRTAMDHFDTKTAEFVLGWDGLTTRALLIVSLGMMYALVVRGALPCLVSALLAMLCFVCFNPVMFSQYLSWIVALGVLALGEYYEQHQQTRNSTDPIGQ